MNNKNGIILICLLALMFSVKAFGQLPAEVDTANGEWCLSWADNFDYPNSQLDKGWESQNGPSGHILCSRWRENAVVKDGILELQARKEKSGGQEWTAGNIWTKKRFNLGEFRVYGVNDGKYPDVLSETANSDIKGLINLVKNEDVKITSSGSYKNNNSERNLLDGNIRSAWSTQNEGDKWIEFEWKDDITVGCVQFVNGWVDKHGNWNGLITDYKVQYFEDGKWIDISTLNVTDSHNFGEEFHTYGLLWNEKELVFYFEGKEIRRESNDFCYSKSPIWLSLAIIKWSGPVTDAIDGTSMKIDYVKYYQLKE